LDGSYVGDLAVLSRAVAMVLVLFIVYAGVRFLEPKRLPAWLSVASSQINDLDLYERGIRGYALYSDYTPVWMKSLARDLTRSRSVEAPTPPPAEAAPTVVVLSERPESFQLQVHAQAPFTLQLPRIFFPDWHVLARGQPLPTGPEGPFGLVTVALPAGDYQVMARFVATPLRRAAEATSALCLLALVVSLAWSRKKVLWIHLCLTAVLAVVLGLHYGLANTGHQPTPVAANFKEELSLLGSELEQTTVRPGDTLGLRLYWLARAAPAKDYTIFIHLIKPDDSAKVAQDDSAQLRLQPHQPVGPGRDHRGRTRGEHRSGRPAWHIPPGGRRI
jgi:hypothetical protein